MVAGPRNREGGLGLPELELKEQTREELKVQRWASRDGLKVTGTALGVPFNNREIPT
jgi:hypothetical protein